MREVLPELRRWRQSMNRRETSRAYQCKTDTVSECLRNWEERLELLESSSTLYHPGSNRNRAWIRLSAIEKNSEWLERERGREGGGGGGGSRAYLTGRTVGLPERPFFLNGAMSELFVSQEMGTRLRLEKIFKWIKKLYMKTQFAQIKIYRSFFEVRFLKRDATRKRPPDQRGVKIASWFEHCAGSAINHRVNHVRLPLCSRNPVGSRTGSSIDFAISKSSDTPSNYG